ncbi:hypothetical protein D3C72_2466700 [compost metagenome]
MLVRTPLLASNNWYSILSRFWYSLNLASTRTFWPKRSGAMYLSRMSMTGQW